MQVRNVFTSNKRRLVLISAIAIIAIVAVSSFAVMEASKSFASMANKKPFYVGVTYCGNSAIEAEQLIDRVKNYTNLFILQSGTLMLNFTATKLIGDYAVNAGLNIILCYTTNCLGENLDSFLNQAQSRWESHFLGVYFNDEPAGHFLDSNFINLSDNDTSVDIVRNTDSISFTTQSGSGLNATSNDYNFYISSGVVTVTSTPATVPSWFIVAGNNTTNQPASGTPVTPTTITYYPNGTICYTTNTTLIYEPNGTVFDENGQVVTNQGNISKFQPYQQVWDSNPLLNGTDVANLYINNLRSTLSSIGNQSYVKLFTSDYALYWFDYQGGYDNVFAELFGTQTDTQTLALVKGAADVQGKRWGVMVEPVSQSPVNLQTGDQIYNELKQAYEDGAQYGVVFNYAPNSNSTAGILQDEQFNAIQKFWVDVVQNPKVTNNVKGQDALVLPNSYASALRSSTDNIWGIWQADNQSQQVYNAVQSSLAQYGSKLDIVYNDPNFSTAGRYQQVVYWNQTNS
jgi:hypothetical protein